MLDKKATGRLCRCIEDAHNGMAQGARSRAPQSSVQAARPAAISANRLHARASRSLWPDWPPCRQPRAPPLPAGTQDAIHSALSCLWALTCCTAELFEPGCGATYFPTSLLHNLAAWREPASHPLVKAVRSLSRSLALLLHEACCRAGPAEATSSCGRLALDIHHAFHPLPFSQVRFECADALLSSHVALGTICGCLQLRQEPNPADAVAAAALQRRCLQLLHRACVAVPQLGPAAIACQTAEGVLKAAEAGAGATALLCLGTLLASAAALPSGPSSQGLLARLAPGTTEQLVQRLLAIMHAVSGDVRLASAAAAAVAGLLGMATPHPPPSSGPLSPTRQSSVSAHGAVSSSLPAPPAPPARLAELAALVPDATLQQLRRLLLWQQPAGAGAPPLPALAEFEGFPGITGMLDGTAALAAVLAHGAAPRLLASGAGAAAARVLLAAANRSNGASGGELSPAGVLSLLQALQRLLAQDAGAIALLQQQPSLVPALLSLVQPAALQAVTRFVDATSACNPSNSLGTAGSLTPLNDGSTAAAALLGGVAAVLYAPFLQPVHSVQHDAALGALQQALAAQPELPATLVAAVAAAPTGSEELAAAVGLLARLVMSSDRLMTAYVRAGGMAPALVEK